MSQAIEAQIIPFSEFERRIESGLIVPMDHGEGLRLIDCGDAKSLTSEAIQQRIDKFGEDIIPGRYLGAATGIGITALIALAAQEGEQVVTQYVEDFGREGLNGFVADVSHRAQALGVDIHRHSADTNEGHASQVAPQGHTHEDNPLGCALEENVVSVVNGSSSPSSVNEAVQIVSSVGMSAPIREAGEGATLVDQHLSQHLSLNRALLRKNLASDLHTPFVVLETASLNHDNKALVIDLAGMRSDAVAHNNEGTSRYHHTPDLVELTRKILPEFRLDPEILFASSVLIGASTRAALSGPQTPNALRAEIIPPEYARAA